MKTAGVIGLGNMGSGLARNLLRAGFRTFGSDLDRERLTAFEAMGGTPVSSVTEMAANTESVFVMLMNGDQAKSVILGADGLAARLPREAVVILTATIRSSEAREIDEAMSGSGVHLIDSPVSGGFAGAQNGTLTMMAAGRPEVLDRVRPVMEAVSANIHRVGVKGGEGQTVKACLQSLIGSIFSATFEAAALAAKAGVPGEVLYDVFSTSAAGSAATSTALANIIDRRFEGTGSHIDTMHKDLTIALNLGERLGVPLHMAAAAMQLFHAGRSKYPDGDNWACIRVIEEIVGAELHR